MANEIIVLDTRPMQVRVTFYVPTEGRIVDGLGNKVAVTPADEQPPEVRQYLTVEEENALNAGDAFMDGPVDVPERESETQQQTRQRIRDLYARRTPNSLDKHIKRWSQVGRRIDATGTAGRAE